MVDVEGKNDLVHKKNGHQKKATKSKPKSAWGGSDIESVYSGDVRLKHVGAVQGRETKGAEPENQRSHEEGREDNSASGNLPSAKKEDQAVPDQS